METLNRLIALCPPADQPLDVLTTAQWNEQFGAIGARLPEELVQINRTYGAGFFESAQSPVNASFGVFGGRVAQHAITRLAELRLQKLRKPNAFPASLYFEPGGILPIGWIAGEIDICLRAEGDNPDKWRVALLRSKTNGLDDLKCSLVDALSALVEGKLASALFSKHLPSSRGYRYRPSRELVQQWHAP